MLNVKLFDKRMCLTLLFVLMFVAMPLSSFSVQDVPEVKTEVTVQNVLIDINTADAIQLSGLPGIGEALADRIIAYRNEYGLFKTTQDLQQVKGIGEKKLSKITTLITVKRPSGQ